MLNYIRSEFYRAARNKNLRIVYVLFLGLIMLGLFATVFYQHHEVNFPYGNTRFLLSNIYSQMNYMMFATLFVSSIIDDGESKNHTMKHSVAFGISRNTIFIGRLIVQMVVCTFFYLSLSAVLTVLSFALLTHSHAGELGELVRISLCGCTSLFAALAIVYFFLMIKESQTVAIGNAFLVIAVLPTIMNIANRKITFFKVLGSLFPYNLVAYDSDLVSHVGNMFMVGLRTTLIGLVWMVAFIALGIYQFNKKELK